MTTSVPVGRLGIPGAMHGEVDRLVYELGREVG